MSLTMKTSELVCLFCILISQTSGYTSTIVHLPQQKSSSAVQYNYSDSRRSPKNSQVEQNIYPSTNYIQSTFPQHEALPQLFNLGYSVRFENQPNQAKKNIQISRSNQNFVNAKLDHGDIITGTRKQNVQIDIPSDSNEEMLVQGQKDIQKRKILGLKTQTSKKSGNSFNSKSVSAQANFSQTTQKYLQALENVKEPDHQQDLSNLYQQKYTWKNLSPNVKIIKSTEIPLPSGVIENRALVFDHAKALSKSEGFGFSDAMREEQSKENNEVAKEKRYNYKQNLQIAPTTAKFNVIPISEEVTQPNIKSNQLLYSVKEDLSQDNTVQKQSQIVIGNPQANPKLVHLVPANLFQTVNGIPLKPPKTRQDVITQQFPKQVHLQQLKMPQYDGLTKIPGKIKYYKKIPNRGNFLHTRKLVSNLDYARNARMKPDIQKEIKLPPEYNISY